MVGFFQYCSPGTLVMILLRCSCKSCSSQGRVLSVVPFSLAPASNRTLGPSLLKITSPQKYQSVYISLMHSQCNNLLHCLLLPTFQCNLLGLVVGLLFFTTTQRCHDAHDYSFHSDLPIQSTPYKSPRAIQWT